MEQQGGNSHNEISIRVTRFVWRRNCSFCLSPSPGNQVVVLTFQPGRLHLSILSILSLPLRHFCFTAQEGGSYRREAAT